jgi:hypothetical protein
MKRLTICPHGSFLFLTSIRYPAGPALAVRIHRHTTKAGRCYRLASATRRRPAYDLSAGPAQLREFVSWGPGNSTVRTSR